MKKKYDLEHEGHAYKVDNINEWVVHIVVRIISIKVVWKNHPNQCTSGVVNYAEQCVAGVQMNWSLFLLNQLMEDAMIMQVGKHAFMYSYFLIFIALVSWIDPEDYQGMDIATSQVCKGA